MQGPDLFCAERQVLLSTPTINSKLWHISPYAGCSQSRVTDSAVDLDEGA